MWNGIPLSDSCTWLLFGVIVVVFRFLLSIKLGDGNLNFNKSSSFFSVNLLVIKAFKFLKITIKIGALASNLINVR
jgi:hypothetical protein